MRRRLIELSPWRWALTYGGTLLVIGRPVVNGIAQEPEAYGPVETFDGEKMQVQTPSEILFLREMGDRKMLYFSDGKLRFSDHSEEVPVGQSISKS